jgi:toluene monooxygenase system protein A
MHELVKWDPQFDWTHKFYHTDNWIAIAARHLFDELLLTSNPIEFALGTNFVFETGFTNLQFIALSALADLEGDRMFEKMVNSIQTDEARHSQIGPAVLEILRKHDKAYAQSLLDKWFWRSWRLFSVLTGFSMDYFTPLEHRKHSFKEFMEEWIIDQFQRTLDEVGLEKPWYWETFLDEMEIYHHMVYASAYTHRATTWFNFVLPSPDERKWLRSKYPKYWHRLEPVWDQITLRWKKSDPETEWWVHGATPVAFCNLCQIVLCGGSPNKNSAITLNHKGRPYIFCSEPCRVLFEKEIDRYADHLSVVDRILAGIAPGNLLELTRSYFSLNQETWGKDIVGGVYPWLERKEPLHG